MTKRIPGRGRGHLAICLGLGAAILALMQTGARAADPQAVIDRAIENVKKFAGPQTTWDGPTSAPPLAKGKSIVFLSGDEQNDISHLYGVYMKNAADKMGWKLTVIDGHGSPTSWLAGLNQAIALKPDGIVMFADAASLQDPMRTAAAQGIAMVGLHAAATPGPHPEINLFYNIQQDTVAIGQAEADWVIADSKGKGRVVILSHNEYAIAATKSGATRDRIKECTGCAVLDYVNSPASEAAQRQPQLTTSWVQRFGLPLYATSVGDNDWDFAVPVLRSAGVKPDEVKLVAADGNRSAYDRIRQGKSYQLVTVSEPIELQAFQALDELNRAFNKAPPSGYVQSPYLVTPQNVNAEGGDKNAFFPSNGYKEHYFKLWGVEAK
ncbi:MAG: substrate-binding domain-containing protein [Methylobacteriaceae bacterium]|nr:substrate-binding domain-containing protein [Methylobacteriaceae bacterium]